MGFIKNILKFLQIISVLMVPISVLQYLFKDAEILRFIEPYNQLFISLYSQYISPMVGSSDFTLIFVMLPWILFIIVIGSVINSIESLEYRVDEIYANIDAKKIHKSDEQKKRMHSTELQKKQAVYLVIELIFSKFTISNLTEDEVEEKIDEIKEHLFGNVVSCRGKLLEEDEFDDKNTVALLFFSQDDALNFLYKFRETLNIIDDDIQSFGYSIGFKAILDSQAVEAIKYYILEFLEKVLKTVELNEISTTSDFAERYKQFGGSKQVKFLSKGTYSINKSRVELNSL